MNHQSAIEIVQQNGKGKYRVVTQTEVKTIRLAITTLGEVMEMAKGKKRYGYPIGTATIAEWISIAPQTPCVTEEQKWRKGWTKVLARLQASGFWRDVQEDIKVGLDVGLDKIRQMGKLRFDESFREKVAEIDPRLVGCSFIEYQMSGLPRVKTMRFSDYKPSNEIYRQRIADAVAKNLPCRIDSRASYDVSLEFRPAGHAYKEGESCGKSPPVPYHRCWFSEEFKGCGNGHYYLALDAIHVLHYEDD